MFLLRVADKTLKASHNNDVASSDHHIRKKNVIVNIHVHYFANISWAAAWYRVNLYLEMLQSTLFANSFLKCS